MQLVRSRASYILSVENITARQQGTRLKSTQVRRLTARTVDQMGCAVKRIACHASQL
jgi:5-enolpyruvylshikimate-3-phosphate synthase